MSQDPTLSESLQTTIRRAAEQAIYDLYGLQPEHIRVVRQHRTLQVGTLQFIDYAIPCFELAKVLKQDANTVAQHLTPTLKLQADKVSDDLGAYEYEAVSGYINIQLSLPYLHHIVQAAANWLQGPRAYDSQTTKDIFMLISANPHVTPEPTLDEQAYRYIHDIYHFTHQDQALTYLLNDFSESTLTKLSVESHDATEDPQQQIKLHRKAKAFIADPSLPGPDDSIRQKFAAIQQALATKHNDILHSLDINDYELIFESSIAMAVQDYLDKLENKPESPIVKDEASQAVYYAYGNEIYALRSASGMLYSAGYLLYMLMDQLLKLEDTQGTLVVLAPSDLHALIIGYSKVLAASRVSIAPTVCFDPRVSQADILQLRSSVNSISEHFGAVSYFLQNLQEEWLEDASIRRTLLSLVDLPETLHQAIHNTQLPALFDAVTESVETLSELSQ